MLIIETVKLQRRDNIKMLKNNQMNNPHKNNPKNQIKKLTQNE